VAAAALPPQQQQQQHEEIVQPISQPPLVSLVILSEEEREAQRAAEQVYTCLFPYLLFFSRHSFHTTFIIQALLDEEMRKRRERVKAWQDARASADKISVGKCSDVLNEEISAHEAEATVDDVRPSGWSLEDDEEDDAVAVEVDVSESGIIDSSLLYR
jgi:hypothetical protein